MTAESGDAYIRRTATFLRAHESRLASAGVIKRLPRVRSASAATSTQSTWNSLNPLGWFTTSDKEIATSYSTDVYHLFYLLIRLEGIGLDVGSLDIKVDSPQRPVSYVSLTTRDTSDAQSIAGSIVSTMSKLSLGSTWWNRAELPQLDQELKYLFSTFTKLPSVSLHPSSPSKLVAELAADPPADSAIPFSVFRSLQRLECVDIDPRHILGWDRLAESLRSLTMTRSGVEDIADILIDAVFDDQGRRDGTVSSSAPRRIVRRQPEPEASAMPTSILSPLKWAFLRHLSLADNALTFFPSTPLPYLTALTHLDLSSNLLVAVPSGLSELHNLVSLNLSNNMIDSVLGIYTTLGQVLTLNLAYNRLESICGLERLKALERVDIRHNSIEESAEVGRLATLPHIKAVWVHGNPFTEFEDDWRIHCFNLFVQEGHTEVLIDGSKPGLYERGQINAAPAAPPPRLSTVPSPPPVQAVAGPSRTKTPIAPLPPPITGSPPSDVISLPSSGQQHAKPRRKQKRVVDLDSGSLSAQSSLPPKRVSGHARHRSDASSGQTTSRRATRVSASLYEPPISEEPSTPSSQDADAYRARIETLRNEVGDGWLKVLNQSQVGSTKAG